MEDPLERRRRELLTHRGHADDGAGGAPRGQERPQRVRVRGVDAELRVHPERAGLWEAELRGERAQLADEGRNVCVRDLVEHVEAEIERLVLRDRLEDKAEPPVLGRGARLGGRAITEVEARGNELQIRVHVTDRARVRRDVDHLVDERLREDGLAIAGRIRRAEEDGLGAGRQRENERHVVHPEAGSHSAPGRARGRGGGGAGGSTAPIGRVVAGARGDRCRERERAEGRDEAAERRGSEGHAPFGARKRPVRRGGRASWAFGLSVDMAATGGGRPSPMAREGMPGRDRARGLRRGEDQRLREEGFAPESRSRCLFA